MKKLTIFAAVGSLSLCASLSTVGCESVGNAPAGTSQSETKAMFDKLPIEERAKTLMDRPGPIEDKRKTIKGMYEKEGKPCPPEFCGDAAAVPPAAGAPPVSTTGGQSR